VPIKVPPTPAAPDPELSRLRALEARVRALLTRPGAITRAGLAAALDPPFKEN
jgi:hypothetical protein